MSRGLVAIVGSPNVGKSTIFNRIIGERQAIVDDQAGITRDRLYGKAEWLTQTFSVVDTGGVEIQNAPFQERKLGHKWKLQLKKRMLLFL